MLGLVAMQAQAELRFINRDAVSVLVGHTTSGGGGSGPDGALLLDLRRHDERSLYGSIPAAHHVPSRLFISYNLSCDTWTRPGKTVGRWVEVRVERIWSIWHRQEQMHFAAGSLRS